MDIWYAIYMKFSVNIKIASWVWKRVKITQLRMYEYNCTSYLEDPRYINSIEKLFNTSAFKLISFHFILILQNSGQKTTWNWLEFLKTIIGSTVKIRYKKASARLRNWNNYEILVKEIYDHLSLLIRHWCTCQYGRRKCISCSERLHYDKNCLL